jgi:hypothetical protein
MFLKLENFIIYVYLCNSRIYVITLYSGHVCVYYASMLRCWHLVRILVRTDHPCLGVGCHTETLSLDDAYAHLLAFESRRVLHDADAHQHRRHSQFCWSRRTSAAWSRSCASTWAWSRSCASTVPWSRPFCTKLREAETFTVPNLWAYEPHGDKMLVPYG